MPSANPVENDEVVVVEIKSPAQVHHEQVNSAKAIWLKCIGYIVSVLEHLGPFWMDYYRRIFMAIKLPSPLKFIIIVLLAFAGMKSQVSEFPFKTHPRSMNVSISSLLFYGLSSAAQHFISATWLRPDSVYAVVAHSGRIGSLCILVASVLCFFYL
ncbi:hypothetical protein LXL04_029776 [Taraxacum kok-saghyz]